ncbi:MAG: peptide ABC transporter substrate-binding protein [Candidatus Eremiobacteraeota bacterium]|nr:peptide ABC transporter substrate-binding protein [Candidatus Eremiobacteraeota bacterium]
MTVATAAMLAGCAKVSTQGTDTGGHSWTQPGVLRIAVQSESKNLNPLLASNTTDQMITRLMFDLLVTADAAGHPVPDLAKVVPTLENGGISKDGLTVTYHLRDGVKWQDGVPLTSKDVKFSYQGMMNNANNVTSRHGYDMVKSVDTPDALTVIFHLKHKFAPVVNTLFAESDSAITIVPQHILAKYPDINRVPFNTEPIGSGPFKLAEWVHGDHYTLVPNPNYFLGAPKLTKIIIKIIPNEDTTLNELRTHDIDWMFEPSYQTYRAVHDMKDILQRFNNVNGYEGMQLNTSSPMLRDKRVRQAIAYAIDKKRLLDTQTFGQETLATEDLPNWMWAFNPNVKVYPYSVQQSRALLAQAGYAPGTDGIMTRNGQRLSLLMVYNVSNATRRAMSVQIQEMLKLAGIDVQIKTFDAATLFAPAGEGGILQLGKFDLGLSGWFAGVDPDDSSNYVSTNIPPGGYNYTRYDSKAMDAAQTMALENYDQPTRKRAYAKIESLLAEDVPQIFFWWDRQAQAINPDFKGFDPNPVTESWNAYQWSI